MNAETVEKKISVTQDLGTKELTEKVEEVHGLILWDPGVIKNESDYQLAGDQQLKAKNLKGWFEKKKKWLLEPIEMARQRISLFVNEPIALCEQFVKDLDKSMADYRRGLEAERIRKEAELRAIAEKEQERLRKEAEAKAKKIEKKNPEKAEEIRANVPIVPAPMLAAPAPKLEGQHTRKVWKCRIADPDAVPAEWRKSVPDEDRIKGYCKSSAESLSKRFNNATEFSPFEGVVFYLDESNVKSRNSL